MEKHPGCEGGGDKAEQQGIGHYDFRGSSVVAESSVSIS